MTFELSVSHEPAPDLFSSAGLPPARSTVPRIREAVVCGRTDCSLRPPALSASYAQRGSLLRTALESTLRDGTSFHASWSVRVTRFGRPYWKLATPERPIGAPAPSSSADWLPTPRAEKGGLPDSHGDLSAWMLTPTETGNMLSLSMEKWAGWWGNWIPTPTASRGSSNGGRIEAYQGKGPTIGVHLDVMATLTLEEDFPTAQDYGSNKGGAAGRTAPERPSLSTLARAWGLSGRQALASIYENMMGFPTGWLKDAAAPTETPSSPLSQKQ